jgi:hypothetical protein
MLSKCVNPDCSNTFRYLHEGRIFYLAPTPDVQIAVGMLYPGLHERFWLCPRCAQEMTVIWAGSTVKVVSLAVQKAPPAPTASKGETEGRRWRTRAASVGREDV